MGNDLRKIAPRRKRASVSAIAGKLRPLPGYSRTQPFTNLEDVRRYFDADKIVCLLCGREYVALGGHIMSVHGMSNDDYRIRFGIPFGYGLAGRTFRLRASRRITRMRKEGRMPQAPSPGTIRKMVRARMSRRPLTEATQRDNLDKIRRIHRKETFWRSKDFKEFFRRIKSGRTVLEVENDKDMPSRHSFLAYLKGDAALRKQYREVWDTLPFAMQVRANKTGESYRRTLVRLRLSGKKWVQVAQIMGVAPSSVRNMWHMLKRSGRLKKYF